MTWFFFSFLFLYLTFFATLSPSAYLAIYCSAIESPPLLSLTDPNIPAVLISINIFCSYICLFLVLLFFLSWYLPFASPYILVCYTRTSWFAGRRLWLLHLYTPECSLIEYDVFMVFYVGNPSPYGKKVSTLCLYTFSYFSHLDLCCVKVSKI